MLKSSKIIIGQVVQVGGITLLAFQWHEVISFVRVNDAFRIWDGEGSGTGKSLVETG